MKSYTVMLMVPQDYDHSNMRDLTWLGTVNAVTPTHAAHVARSLCAADNEREPDDYECLAVFADKVSDLYEPSVDTPDRNASLDDEMAAHSA